MSLLLSRPRTLRACRLLLTLLCTGLFSQGLSAQARGTAPADRDLVDGLVIKGVNAPQGNGAAPAAPATGTTSGGDARSLDAGNALLITEPLGRDRTQMPIQIGRPFARGEYKDSVQVALAGQRLPTQVDVKNRWPDGSLRFAVLSFVLPQLTARSSVKLSIEASATQAQAAPATAEVLRSLASHDAVLELSQNGRTLSTSLQKALSQATPMVWTQGAINTTWVLADHSAQRALDLVLAQRAVCGRFSR